MVGKKREYSQICLWRFCWDLWGQEDNREADINDHVKKFSDKNKKFIKSQTKGDRRHFYILSYEDVFILKNGIHKYILSIY